MEPNEHAGLIPPQEEGAQKDIHETALFEEETDAEDFFLVAKDRLLDMNNWHEYAGEHSAHFMLTDTHGNELNRYVHTGDMVRIDIPGPGTKTGDSYDWVKVEAVVYDDYPDEHVESIAIKVRPAANPIGNTGDTAHFFADDATSTFVVLRMGNKVTASIYGRNEKPNTATGKWLDNIRNAAVAVGAIHGMSNLQWGQLAKGIMRDTQ